MSRSNERYFVFGQNNYQPPRDGAHSRVSHVQTDPQGFKWNVEAAQKCYIPQLERGTFQHVSLDFYATMRRELKELSPQNAPQLKEAMRSRGVGDPFLHVLLPDLKERDKNILIGAGKQAFIQDAGVAPQWFWAPECALDDKTLAALIRAKYKGVICAPEQVISSEATADNKPFTVTLPGHGSITVLPFDRPLSSSIAFDPKNNADAYARNVVMPRMNNLPSSLPLVGWTDGETFGLHAEFADIFLHYLVTESLPRMGVAMLGINQVFDVWQKQDYKTGKIKNPSAWSCPHQPVGGKLARWHGACPCDSGFHGGWKAPFMDGLHALNNAIDVIIDKELSSPADRTWPEQLIANFSTAFSYKGGSNTKMSLFAAKASGLACLTSCGTFFDTPQTSGRINIMFARQALEHLVDAQKGKEAATLMKTLKQRLSQGRDPHTGKTLDQLFGDILSL
jgi:hypothetical protein